MKPIKVYGISPKQASYIFILAMIDVLCYFFIPNKIFLGLGTFFLFFGIYVLNAKPIKLFPTYIEICSPLTPKKSISYHEIIKLERDTRSISIINKTQQKIIKIPVKLLGEENITDFSKKVKKYCSLAQEDILKVV